MYITPKGRSKVSLLPKRVPTACTKQKRLESIQHRVCSCYFVRDRFQLWAQGFLCAIMFKPPWTRYNLKSGLCEQHHGECLPRDRSRSREPSETRTTAQSSLGKGYAITLWACVPARLKDRLKLRPDSTCDEYSHRIVPEDLKVSADFLEYEMLFETIEWLAGCGHESDSAEIMLQYALARLRQKPGSSTPYLHIFVRNQVANAVAESPGLCIIFIFARGNAKLPASLPGH